jgi:hypothetical protein
MKQHRMKSPDEFTRAYITAALWSSNDYTDEQGGEPLDKNYGPDDLSPECLASMVADCAAFQKENATDLNTIEGRQYDDGYSTGYERAGHDFWLTRNHHGVGFWARDDIAEGVRDRLTDAAHAFRDFYLYLGDDNQICGV